MNAALDYDALEILGAALRDKRMSEPEEPMGDELAALCRRLEGGDDNSAAPTTERVRRDS